MKLRLFWQKKKNACANAFAPPRTRSQASVVRAGAHILPVRNRTASAHRSNISGTLLAVQCHFARSRRICTDAWRRVSLHTYGRRIACRRQWGARTSFLQVQAPDRRHDQLDQLGKEIHTPFVVAVAATFVLRDFRHHRCQRIHRQRRAEVHCAAEGCHACR